MYKDFVIRVTTTELEQAAKIDGCDDLPREYWDQGINSLDVLLEFAGDKELVFKETLLRSLILFSFCNLS